jgi:hypothetical protein
MSRSQYGHATAHNPPASAFVNGVNQGNLKCARYHSPNIFHSPPLYARGYRLTRGKVRSMQYAASQPQHEKGQKTVLQCLCARKPASHYSDLIECGWLVGGTWRPQLIRPFRAMDLEKTL